MNSTSANSASGDGLPCPSLAGLAGMVVAVGIYLLFNAGRSSAHGWGVAMSTDTAFALGLLALVGPRFPDRLRAFMLTVVVVDDIAALIVIATVYSGSLSAEPLLAAFVFYGAIFSLHRLGLRIGLVYLVLGVAAWVALLKSGVEPVVIGLAMGVLPFATSGAPLDPRARDRAVPRVPRTADRRARTNGGRAASRGYSPQ